MSVVAAARYGSLVVVGCDSLVTTGEIIHQGSTKVHRVGSALVGVVGSCEHELPAVAAIMALENVDPRTIGDAARDAVSDDDADVEMLVAWGGRLWLFDHWHPHEVVEPYHAIGAGWQVALGAMWGRDDADPAARVDVALRAASAHCASVGGRLHVMTL